MTRTLLKRCLPGTLIAIMLLTVFGCADHSEETLPGDSEKVLAFGIPKYVGSDECKNCHWREHDSWKHTLHSRFAKAPDDFSVIGDFLLNNELKVKVTNKSPKLAGQVITTAMRRENGKYYVNTIGPDGKLHSYEVMTVIGINERQNYLTKFPNGEIHVLPVEWNADKRIWTDNNGLAGHYPGDGGYWSDRERIWQFKCAGCHVTGMKINFNTENDTFDTKWAEVSIGCEACHGPASNHIKAAKEYYEGEKDTIINPAKLPWKLRAMVCGQCHSLGMSTAAVQPAKRGFPAKYSYAFGFLPGKSLDLFSSGEGAAYGKSRLTMQYDEWRESVHAERGIMCSTCHGVHQEGFHKSPNKAQTKLPADNLCKSCHTSVERRAAHRIHTFGSCIDCHMPKIYGKARSHNFKFISPVESIKAGGVKIQPNSCSGCHHHKDTPLEDLAGFLKAAKNRDMPKPFSAHRDRTRR